MKTYIFLVFVVLTSCKLTMSTKTVSVIDSVQYTKYYTDCMKPYKIGTNTYYRYVNTDCKMEAIRRATKINLIWIYKKGNKVIRIEKLQ